MKEQLQFKENYQYQRVYPKISGYTTTYNCENLGAPYLESVKSMLGFCSEVVVVDGCSTDGTYEKLQELSKQDDRVKVYQNEFNWQEPGVDGNQKSFARALCENEFCWQMDADEVVHEEFYEKIKMICKRFPSNADILHLPVVELWGDEKHFTGRRHAWKWRLSRNKPEITHGINKFARIVDEKTGLVYAQRGMSDGCEYCNIMDYSPLPHTGFWNEKYDFLRTNSPKEYEKTMNYVFSNIPTVWHTSWLKLGNKVKQLRKGGSWSKLWALLYQQEEENRFPDCDTEEKVSEMSQKLYEQGGEESDRIKFKCDLVVAAPKLLMQWIENGKK